MPRARALRGSTTVPAGAVKSSTPACVRPPRLLSSKNMAPFLGASWSISSRPAAGGSRICAI